jgi:hypothetical protein
VAIGNAGAEIEDQLIGTVIAGQYRDRLMIDRTQHTTGKRHLTPPHANFVHNRIGRRCGLAVRKAAQLDIAPFFETVLCHVLDKQIGRAWIRQEIADKCEISSGVAAGAAGGAQRSVESPRSDAVIDPDRHIAASCRRADFGERSWNPRRIVDFQDQPRPGTAEIAERTALERLDF